jgi:tRNA dimethylallyltransferase
MKPAPVVLLVGPTAAGKSAVALELAQRLNGEIVSVDSAQVYRGMDIGTAKPDRATQDAVAHHLIDIVDPTDAYSAARFADDAVRAIATIRAREKLPILAGGTMLYFKALTEGLSELPRADPVVRAQIDAEARQRGWPALHDELATVDPVTAARLAPGDAQRIQRALEVFRVSGSALSALQGRRAPLLAASVDVIRIAIVPADRAQLHELIAQRFDQMLAQGLVDEVRALRLRFGLTRELPSMRCVGYRQAWSYLEGEIDLEGLRAQGVAATRQLAKRQYTWLRATPAHRFDPDDHGMVDAIVGLVRQAS